MYSVSCNIPCWMLVVNNCRVISDLAPEPKAKVTQRVENLNTSNTLEEPIAAPRKKKKKKLVDDQDQVRESSQLICSTIKLIMYTFVEQVSTVFLSINMHLAG